MASKWVGDAFGREGIYDAHIILNGYPFLGPGEEYEHMTVAADVMQPQTNEPLSVFTQDSMTLGQVEAVLNETDHNGFPVIISTESQYLVGFVLRRDLILAIRAAKNRMEDLSPETPVFFTSSSSHQNLAPSNESNDISSRSQSLQGGRSPLKFGKILDLAPITIADKTPMETVVDMFRKLGLRQTLVTHNGRLLGIITKKDVLRHIKKMEDEEHEAVLFD